MDNLSPKNQNLSLTNIFSMLISIIKSARPTHWTKNLALFAALIFSGNLFSQYFFLRTVIAFISFSLATSGVYIFNDILDASKDRFHPIKKFRPIAAGKMSPQTGFVSILFFTLISLTLAFSLSSLFFYLISGYVLLQVLYSLYLKNIQIIDILVIATGFIIRIYAGAFVIDAHLSVWFLLCVISVALFLASGKRRAEIGAVDSRGATRKSLKKYSKELLNSFVTMFGNAAWLSWALFTFFESPRANLNVWLFLAELSRTTTVSKLLMITIPFAIFAIMRYEFLIFEDRSEAPEKILLTDIPLIISVGLWTSIVVWVLYFASTPIV